MEILYFIIGLLIGALVISALTYRVVSMLLHENIKLSKQLGNKQSELESTINRMAKDITVIKLTVVGE